MSKPILYYSPKCNHCINLWNELKKKNLLDTITKINIHQLSSIPGNIKEVPSLYIQNRPVLSGQAITMYFETATSNNTKPEQKQTVQSSAPQSNIQDYMPGEMSSSWSDQYSFLDDNKPINHSYSFLSNTQSNTPNTQNMQNTNDQKNDKRSDLDLKYEQLKQQRNV